MTIPERSIQVKVDVTNPGQFFACCGLLELADRLWPGAEGWFADGQFCIASRGDLGSLLAALVDTEINSSLTDAGLKRLGTLLSAEKASLTEAELAEKHELSQRWKTERLRLEQPFGLWLDWWWDEPSGASGMKTWAAKQLVLEIARPQLRALKTICNHEPLTDILQRSAKVEGLPFYFDSDVNSQNTPRDTGFGVFALRNILEFDDSTKPAQEICAFFGIQRFRPRVSGRPKAFQFTVWPTPLPLSVAPIAMAGRLAIPGERTYAFRMLYRSQYMKAFLPASPTQGV